MVTEKVVSINDVLAYRAKHEPLQLAYSFEVDKSSQLLELSCADLYARVCRVAASLSARDLRGERVLLALSHGPEFLYALYACLALGAIAVPVVPPSKKKPNPKLQAIVRDAEPAVVLTHGDLSAVFETDLAYAGARPAVLDIATVDAAADDFIPPAVSGDEIAFLQYTSGSTGDPKGVMVSHRNVVENIALTSAAAGTGRDSRGVIWLPFYHDMGLIGGVFHSMLVGAEQNLLISPVSFVQKPIRWLELMSEQRSTIAVAPNFALELCCDKVTEAQLAALDLSSIKCLMCGAEPVNAKTIARFVEVFSRCGFDAGAVMPSYGMAEATLYASGALESGGPTVVSLDAARLAGNEVRDSADGEPSQELVSNGFAEDRLLVVEPSSNTVLGEDQVGELWVSGSGVAGGYWRRPELSAEVFGARPNPAQGDKEYYKTGDLGFLRGGRVYITGRIKDLIIIRAKNHYPQDIEDTATRAHELLMNGSAAAFSMDRGDGEELVLMAEVSRQAIKALKDENTAAAVVDTVVQAVSAQHEVRPAKVLLLKPARLLKTSSGKVQRQANKQALLAGDIEALHAWEQAANTSGGAYSLADEPLQMFADRADIEGWLLRQLSARSAVAQHDIALDRPFSNYGLDSLAAIELVGEINKRLPEERQIDPIELWNYSTVTSLLDHLYPRGEAGGQGAEQAQRKSTDEQSEIDALRALLGD